MPSLATPCWTCFPLVPGRMRLQWWCRPRPRSAPRRRSRGRLAARLQPLVGGCVPRPPQPSSSCARWLFGGGGEGRPAGDGGVACKWEADLQCAVVGTGVGCTGSADGAGRGGGVWRATLGGGASNGVGGSAPLAGSAAAAPYKTSRCLLAVCQRARPRSPSRPSIYHLPLIPSPHSLTTYTQLLLGLLPHPPHLSLHPHASL